MLNKRRQLRISGGGKDEVARFRSVLRPDALGGKLQPDRLRERERQSETLPALIDSCPALTMRVGINAPRRE